MSHRFGSVHRYLALGCFVLSSLIAYQAYGSIIENRQSKKTLLPSLKWGETRYVFTSHSKCVGTFASEVKRDGGDTHLVARGELRVSVSSNLLRPTLYSEAVFNSLGQLGAGLFRVDLNDSTIIIGFTNINPITVSLRTVQGGQESRYETMIPGPILMRRVTPTTFDFEYGNAKAIAGLLSGTVSQPFLARLGLNLHEVSKESDRCEGDNGTSLDLSEAVTRLEDLRSRFFTGRTQ